MAKMTTMAAAVRILQSEGVKYISGFPARGFCPSIEP